MSASGAPRTTLARLRLSHSLVFLYLLLSSSLAGAFIEQSVQLKGVLVTAVSTTSGPCGVDFIIKVTDGDQHLVKIDYYYVGDFQRQPGSPSFGVYSGTKTGVINVTVGRNTFNGNLARVPANGMGLICNTWNSHNYHFVTSEYNATQDQRDYREGWQQKEQARLDEIKRREEEALANKRRAEQQQRDFQASQEKQKRDRLEAYRRASPENARCIINEPADITRCEQWKAQEKSAQQQRDAAAARMREIEAARGGVERAGVDAVAKASRDMEANNCAYAAALPDRIPYPKTNTNNAQYQAEVKRIDALNWEIQQKFHRDVKAASDACDARRGRATAVQPNQQYQIQQQQEAQRIQAEQQRQYEARQRALADLEVQVQRGQQTVNDAAANTRSMQNDNANLQDMINRMK